METLHILRSSEELADYLLDELGRWIAEGCPEIFKSRKFKTSLFSHLYDREIKRNPLSFKFTNNGFIVIRIITIDDAYMAIRLPIADPRLRDQLIDCFVKLDAQNFEDFMPVDQARVQWRRSLI